MHELTHNIGAELNSQQGVFELNHGQLQELYSQQGAELTSQQGA
nr:hypothetical protein [Mycoplasmopsis bovis]